MSKTKIILLFTGFLLMVGFFGISAPVSAELDGNAREEIVFLQDEIRAKKEAVAKLEEKIETAKSSIERKRLEALSLKNQIGVIDSGLEAVQLDIEATQLEIETVELELQQLQLEIEQKTQQINRYKEILGEFIRTIHRESDRTYVELLLSNETFSEFFSRVQYLESIYSDMEKQTGSLKSAREELQAKEDVLSEKQSSLEELEEGLVAKSQDLGNQRGYKEQLLVDTKENETVFQGMLSDLRAQYQEIENEIQVVERQIRLKLEDSDELGGGGEVVLSWPVPSRYITSYFHDPDYPFRHIFEHSGIDIRAGQGTALKAAAPGYVARAKKCSNSWCYSYVMIIHGDNISTLYGHMSQISVGEDQFVGRGDIIGYSGGTPGTAGAGPFVTGPHLHFETRLNGIPVNPLNYLL